MLLRGWVFSITWKWFLVPLGLPAISVVHAIGVAGVVGLLVQSPTQPKLGGHELAVKVGVAFMYPLLELALLWAVHLCM
jgi:hypothetical protein